MKLIAALFIVVIFSTVIRIHSAEPWVGAAVTAGKVVGGALAGTAVADAFHAVGGDKIVKAVTNAVNGTVDAAKSWTTGAVDTAKNIAVDVVNKTVNAAEHAAVEGEKFVNTVTDTVHQTVDAAKNWTTDAAKSIFG